MKQRNKGVQSIQLHSFYFKDIDLVIVFGDSPRIFKPQQDKTNKITCAPSGDTDQPGHLLIFRSGQSFCCTYEETLVSARTFPEVFRKSRGQFIFLRDFFFRARGVLRRNA